MKINYVHAVSSMLLNNRIHPIKHKIEAVQKALPPTNVSIFRSFLGSVNYYARFIPKMQQNCVHYTIA